MLVSVKDAAARAAQDGGTAAVVAFLTSNCSQSVAILLLQIVLMKARSRCVQVNVISGVPTTEEREEESADEIVRI